MDRLYIELAAILVQACAFVWWMSRFSTSVKMRLDHVEKWQDKNDDIASDIAALKVELSSVSRVLTRIEAHLADRQHG